MGHGVWEKNEIVAILSDIAKNMTGRPVVIS